MTQIQYGSTERSQVIDEHGSTLTTLIKYHRGAPAGPISNRLRLRHPTDSLDVAELGKMVKNLLTDPDKINPAIEIDRKVVDGNTKFYIIESYTIIE